MRVKTKTERGLVADNPAFNTFADASLAIIPATIFWQLNNTRTEKIQLTIVFGLNILTSICSGIKTQYLAALGDRKDQTWATYDIFVWVTGELFLMIVCGTIPTLHTVLQWCRGAASDIRSKVTPNATHSIASVSDGEEHGEELSDVTYMQVRTKTVVGSGPSRSVERLVEMPSDGVRVDKAYDVRRDQRPNYSWPR